MPGGRPVRWEDFSLAVGAASILLPSAAEGSCPVELGNPPIPYAAKGRHRFANKASVAPEWCFKESRRNFHTYKRSFMVGAGLP